MFSIFLPGSRILRSQIVAFIGQAEASLIGAGDLHFCVRGIRSGLKLEEDIDSLPVQPGNNSRKVRFVFDRPDAPDARLDWLIAYLVHFRRVHARGIESSDLLVERGTILMRC